MQWQINGAIYKGGQTSQGRFLKGSHNGNRYNAKRRSVMDELREKISKLLDEYLEKMYRGHGTPRGVLADKILALLPQWISVDNPPEINGRAYWVHNKFGEHEAWFINNEFFLRSNMSPIHEVTHWMPLPQPPKEKP